MLAASAIAPFLARHLEARAQSGLNSCFTARSSEDWCRVMAEAFSRETGINVLLNAPSSGET